ncbi:MAG: hypothetical protein ACTHOF_11315 [Flavisolibacter sp.]|jgi:hypothetical protein
MEERNRNQSSQTEQRNENLDQRNTQQQRGGSEEQNVNVSNPQSGDEWSNYRTRELSGNQNSSSDENLSDE